MPAKIITLKGYRRGVRFRNPNISFPQLYRVRGYYFEDVDGETVASNTPKTCYTFDEDDACGLAKTTAEPIDRLDPQVDSGWLIAPGITTAKRRKSSSKKLARLSVG